MLDFTENIGWVTKEDRQAVKEAHLQEIIAHADAHPNHPEWGPVRGPANLDRNKSELIGGEGMAGMPHIKGSHSPPRKGQGAGSGGRFQGTQSHSMPGPNGAKGNNPPTNKSFDYSRVSGGIGVGMVEAGAVGNSYDSAGSVGSEGRGGRGGGRRGPGSQGRSGPAQGQQPAFNPYMQQPQGQPINATGRGSGTGHFNPQVERKSTDRSLIYTNNK
jgi:hypothetical protein